MWIPADYDYPEAEETADTGAGELDLVARGAGSQLIRDGLARERNALEQSNAEAELRARVTTLEDELLGLRNRASSVAGNDDDYVILDDDRVLQSVGIYRYHHPLESAAAYKDRLDELNRRVAECVKGGTAIVASNMFTYDNSLAKGRQMTADLSKLMLRAYNAEATT